MRNGTRWKDDPMLNWKQKSPRTWRALASRAVGGVYRIEYHENFHGSYHHNRGFWVRSYMLHYDNGNVSQVPHRTFEEAAALAEFHHRQMREHGSVDQK